MQSFATTLPVLLLLAATCTGAEPPVLAAATAPRLHRIVPQTPADLRALLRWTGEPLPIVSAHRGGAAPGAPENCLATFERTLRRTFALLEVDPRLTRDGEIVLHHDAALERTTNGQGAVRDCTLAELQKLRLKDPAGELTECRIPTLGEALEWARGRTVLVLDQKDVSIEERVRLVTHHRAEAFTILIVYSFRDVQACHRLNPEICMEVMIPSREKLAEFERLGVPWSNVVAFVGHTPPDDAGLFAAIHQRGARCIVGTSRNLDRRVLSGEAQIADLRDDYRKLIAAGADLIETDIPVDLGGALFAGSTVPDSLLPWLRVE